MWSAVNPAHPTHYALTRFSQQLTAALIQNVPLAISKIHIMRHMLRVEVKAVKWLPDIRRRHALMF